MTTATRKGSVIKGSLVCALGLVAILGLGCQLVSAGSEQSVYLPPDCDVLTINGEGFQVRFEAIKKEWSEVSDESAKVELPRGQVGDVEDEPSAAAAAGEAEPKLGVVDENLFETARAEEDGADLGELDQSLYEWVAARASKLMSQVERYNEEVKAVRVGSQRVVIRVLLLNTLVDLDNLVKEDIAKLRWVSKKFVKLLRDTVHREANSGEVDDYVRGLIDRNLQIESKVRGTNDPGKEWVVNTQALRRVLHEQRYSEALSDVVVQFLSGSFNMMKRSVVYQINKRPKTLDDGLFYPFAVGRVPASFPFSAQDAISHGEDI